MWHVKSVLVKSNFVSFGFKVTSKSRRMSVRFWEAGRLFDLEMLQCGRDAPVIKCQLSMIPHFLGVFSISPEVVSFGGVVDHVIKVLDRSPSSKFGVLFSSDFKSFNLEKLSRQRSYIVMGRVDMFALLNSRRPRLLVGLELKWLQSAQYLRKVGQSSVKNSKNDLIS